MIANNGTPKERPTVGSELSAGLDPAWFNMKTLNRLGDALQKNKEKMIAQTQEEGTDRIWLTVAERSHEIDQMSALIEQMKKFVTV